MNALNLIKKNIKFHCVLIGKNIDENNLKLNNQIAKLKLSKFIKLMGQKDKIIDQLMK